MLANVDRRTVRRRVRHRIRAKISGTAALPRLAVFRSGKHMYAQAIDDASGTTLAHASTLEAEVKGRGVAAGNLAGAKAVGTVIAERLKAAGVATVVFDRGGFLYHGRVKALAEAAREAGLKF